MILPRICFESVHFIFKTLGQCWRAHWRRSCQYGSGNNYGKLTGRHGLRSSRASNDPLSPSGGAPGFCARPTGNCRADCSTAPTTPSSQKGQGEKEQKVRVRQVRVPDVAATVTCSTRLGGAREGQALPLPLRWVRLSLCAQTKHGQTCDGCPSETATLQMHNMLQGIISQPYISADR